MSTEIEGKRDAEAERTGIYPLDEITAIPIHTDKHWIQPKPFC